MKNILFYLILLLSFNCFAQKIRVQNFRLISYGITSSRNIEIDSYSTIDPDGRLNIYVNGNSGAAYYTAQLSDDEINVVNKLAEKDLRSFIRTKKLSTGMYYAGGRDYISFNQGKTQSSMCFIAPFMTEEFNEVIGLLTDKIYKQDDSTKMKQFKIDFIKIKAEIYRQGKIDNFLPKKELPPSL
ncbi:hypothetical protein SAMN05421827_11841 [Pedobacter terrae]|uniref:Uncharacterized protein n=1 Tax=Pedobacter terrae TaxID=405671 RepID=A0A1G8AA37_9SPHI|nr:hypothetical protein [Pedobacter terrae]SDH17240.1 hypothetical protein SAMN05421827_11841 [Pedobacter terrae]